MMSMLSEVGHGPIHVGRAVSLEDDVDFDQVVIVSYPGIRYFVEMAQSRFYTGIFGGKQLGMTCHRQRCRYSNVLTQNDPLREAWLHHFYDPENHT